MNSQFSPVCRDLKFTLTNFLLRSNVQSSLVFSAPLVCSKGNGINLLTVADQLLPPVLPSLCEGVLCPFTSFSEFTLSPWPLGQGHVSYLPLPSPEHYWPGWRSCRLVLEVWRKQRASPGQSRNPCSRQSQMPQAWPPLM